MSPECRGELRCRRRVCDDVQVTEVNLDRVPVLLAELDEYPDSRAEIIFDLSAELARAGRTSEAFEWLGRLAEGGGVDGAQARVEMAYLHYQAGRVAEAEAELATVVASPLADPGPYASAAEMLTELGNDRAAVRWFTMAAVRLTPDQIADASGEDGWTSWAFSVLWQRREARQRLGLPADDLDAGLVPPPALRSNRLHSMDDVAGKRVPGGVRVMLWTESEFDAAQHDLAGMIDHSVSFEQYRDRLEEQLRALAAGGTSVTLVPARAAEMRAYADRAGGSVQDDAIRRGYFDDVAQRTGPVGWPPGRNAPCWCGSGAKYKRCCARRTADPTN